MCINRLKSLWTKRQSLEAQENQNFFIDKKRRTRRPKIMASRSNACYLPFTLNIANSQTGFRTPERVHVAGYATIIARCSRDATLEVTLRIWSLLAGSDKGPGATAIIPLTRRIALLPGVLRLEAPIILTEAIHAMLDFVLSAGNLVGLSKSRSKRPARDHPYEYLHR